MATIRWKENQVISIQTQKNDVNRQENTYVLAQMVGKAYLLVFNLFNKDNNWDHIDLNTIPVLFCCCVGRQMIKASHIFKQNITPIPYGKPEVKISPLGFGTRKLILWKDTVYEKEVLVIGQGGGELIKETFDAGSFHREIINPSIDIQDTNTINRYELTSVRLYPELNERLYLCYKLGRNVDPLKDLIFNRPIPVEYKDYIECISSPVYE